MAKTDTLNYNIGWYEPISFYLSVTWGEKNQGKEFLLIGINVGRQCQSGCKVKFQMSLNPESLVHHPSTQTTELPRPDMLTDSHTWLPGDNSNWHIILQ